MSEKEPTRLLDDPSVNGALRADLAASQKEWVHRGDSARALATFQASIAAGAPPAATKWVITRSAWCVRGGMAILLLGAAIVTTMLARRPSSSRQLQPRAVHSIAAIPSSVVIVPDAAVIQTVATVDQAVPIAIPPHPHSSQNRGDFARLQREAQWMNLERHEAATGDASSALRLARQGDREFPHGEFVAEREAWSIVALDRLGRHTEANARARSFLSQYPRVPQSEMVRRILSGQR